MSAPERPKRTRVELFLVLKRRIHAGAALFAAALAALPAGCARKTTAHVPSSPAASARIGATETGIASWYGIPYHGRPAASGEIYDMEQLTAAHPTLPFGAWVEVTDLDNGKRVKVRVNDRGPFASGRVIDLSQAAAREIGMLGPGTARVRVVVIRPPAAQYAVQAGAFSDRARAEAFRASLADRFKDAHVVEGPPLWHVLIGHELTRDAANKLAARVRKAAGGAVVVNDR